jgi:hypothetical protein
MSALIQEHVSIISKTEKNRLLRERIHFVKDSREYTKNLEASKAVYLDTADNLAKMCIRICEAFIEADKLVAALPAEYSDMEMLDDNKMVVDPEKGIEDRISKQRAIELCDAWKLIRI